jgi:hypothetical protein
MVKYTRELLEECLERDNAELIEEYDKLNSKVFIKFKCSCGEEGEKSFFTIYKHGGFYCKFCTSKNKRTKGLNSNKFMYDLSFLNNCIKNNNASLCEEYKELTVNTHIKFTCKCGNVNSKTFETIRETGAYCRDCTRINTSNKTNTNCYTINTLIDTLKNYNATIEGEYKNINVETNINFICSCGKMGNKAFRRIYEYAGAYCEDCTNKLRLVKFENTIVEKYGVKSIFQLQEIQDKIKNTNLEKRGVGHHSQCKEVQDKRKNTCLEKYGVESVMQKPEIALKNLNACLKPKEYILPSGNKIKVQGYEPLALDIVVNKWKIREEDIITERTKVPEIWWKDTLGKLHRYYTDLFIPSKNLLIEIKSTWTYKLEKDITQYKLLSAKEVGYNTLLWVFDIKKKIVEEYENCNFEINKVTN